MKLVAVCWDPTQRSRAVRGEQFRGAISDQLLAAGVQQLFLQVADEHARVRSPSPFPLFGTKPVAVVNAWASDPMPVIAILESAGYKVAAWPAEESVYKDYGDNAHSGPRTWPDGARSPGITVVSLLERPASLDRDEWIRRWHGVMSPVSERIQPRTRYVRNVLEAPLTPDAPAIEGLVEECWPSGAHLTNPMLFYGAGGPVELVRNMAAIIQAVSHCFWIWRIQSVVMSEYFMFTREPTNP
ncbi:MAG: hypothetical protein GWP91_14245 [Rhodobacterales bacterium]|nr:hypothetical protein [Rhodobacterales bacterium]